MRQVINKDKRNEIIHFAQMALNTEKYRHDYKELLELSILFLGGEVPLYQFKRPGAITHARWMSKVLYCLKMWMFQDQLILTTKERQCLKEISLFSVLIYLKAWITAPIAATAPYNDLNLLKYIRQYHNKNIAESAESKFGSHLWYLSEELVGLALFDTTVPLTTKRLMIKRMNDPQTTLSCPKRIDLQYDPLPTLDMLTTRHSFGLFCALNINTSFMCKDPSTWESDSDYNDAIGKIKNIKVVNDDAERGISLIKEYNAKHTKDEEQFQYLLKIVEQHRKKNTLQF